MDLANNLSIKISIRERMWVRVKMRVRGSRVRVDLGTDLPTNFSVPFDRQVL